MKLSGEIARRPLWHAAADRRQAAVPLRLLVHFGSHSSNWSCKKKLELSLNSAMATTTPALAHCAEPTLAHGADRNDIVSFRWKMVQSSVSSVVSEHVTSNQGRYRDFWSDVKSAGKLSM